MLSNIEDRVVTLISETGQIPKEEVTLDTRMEDLNIDSLVIAELSLKLRIAFDVPPDIDQELDQAETVKEVIDIVKRSEARKSS